MSLDVYLNDGKTQLFTANITHNLGEMADEAGIYKHLWRPEEIGIRKAGELIAPLRQGLHKLVERPSHFKTFNAPNGWGKYEHFIPFVAEYLEACIQHPDATIEVCR